MARVRIVTDVTANLQPEFIAKHQITVLPMEIRMGDQVFVIGSGDDPTPLFAQMAAGPAESARATVPSSALQEAYERLCRQTEEVLVIPSSSKLSDIYDKARTIGRTFLGRCRITVIDSMSASWGLGLMVEAAARAASEGQLLDEIVRLVRGMLPHTYLVFVVERLDFLERGGRVGVAQALLGTMLRIKPLLLMEGGDIIPMEKVRTRTMALEKLVEFVAEFASIQQVVVLQSPLDNGMNDAIGELQRMLGEILPNQEFPVVDYDPLIACHLGPEALGVVVYEGMY
jgi:DegV family protein with EDD domain